MGLGISGNRFRWSNSTIPYRINNADFPLGQRHGLQLLQLLIIG